MQIPIIVLAGQSNASYGGVDNRIVELLGSGSFEFVKVALANTSIFANADQDWAPASGELYSQLVTSVQTAMARVVASGNTPVVSTLWMQGEFDGAHTTAEYRAQEEAFIKGYRAAIGAPSSEFVISLLPFDGNVRSAQLQVDQSLGNTDIVETRGLSYFDGVHLDKLSREAVAERFLTIANIHAAPAGAYTSSLRAASVTNEGGRDFVNGPDFKDFSWTQGGTPSRIDSYSGDDTIQGGSSADTIVTRDNNDWVDGGAGDDYVDAGLHDDTVYGGDGNDTINGAGGDDFLRGGFGDDTLIGGSGFDDMHGNQGNDTERGGDGPDWVVGGQGNDMLYGDAGDDIVYGNLGADTADGGDGVDWVRGGQGNDSLSGGAGNDWMSGDMGDDTISGGSGADIFHSWGAAGIDRITDFSRAEGDRIQLDPGSTYTVAQLGADTVISVGGGAQVILVGVTASTLTGDWIFIG